MDKIRKPKYQPNLLSRAKKSEKKQRPIEMDSHGKLSLVAYCDIMVLLNLSWGRRNTLVSLARSSK
jgi:hypothetical protein